MTDVELIGYCESHCETPRALFSGEMINRILDLAGNPKGTKHIDSERWVSVHEEMKDLCKLARLRRAVGAKGNIPKRVEVVSMAEWKVKRAHETNHV